MDFFKYFPMLTYNGVATYDLFKRFTLSDEIISDAAYYEHYAVQDGETPESLAKRFYGSSKYTWLILLANDIHNPYYDWVMTDSEVFKLVQRKYGVGFEYAIHHFEAYNDPELEDGTFVDQSYPRKISVTNLDYETRLNEKKRHVKIIMPNMVGGIENALKDYFRTAVATV